jgi:hypothetical protein
MSRGANLWLIIFAISAAIFFIIASIVAVKGVGDLKVLLRKRENRD